ncbi:hypothetical protein V2J31_15715 [Bacillus safensis]|uniref:hypothetical protein n=1 Tax=Bacillus safensis TaxID=561879 RepID=UPI002EA6638D|nr:hypothetical protein [Bacillus safensis]
MNWLEFWSKIIDSMAWPLAVVALVFLLRNKIGKLLSFKFKDAEAIFHVLEDGVNNLELLDSENDNPLKEVGLRPTKASELTLVIISWKKVQTKLDELSSLAQMKIDGPGYTRHQYKLLIDIGALPAEIYDSLTIAEDMQRKFFNGDIPITTKSVKKYIQLCNRLIEIIDNNIQTIKSKRPSH